MEKYTDVLVTDDGIALDAVGNPILISGRASIAQDIKHMIRETGLLVEMIGERNPERVKLKMVRLENKIEDDLRIKPGTAKITRSTNETFFIVAKTIEYGDVEFYL
jgi:hypothetical protein